MQYNSNFHYRDIRGVAYSYFFNYLYDNRLGINNHIITKEVSDDDAIRRMHLGHSGHSIRKITNHANDVLTYKKIIQYGDELNKYYLVTDIKNDDVDYAKIVKNLINHLLWYRHTTKSTWFSKKHFPKYGAVMKKCCELILPQISDNDFTNEIKILDMYPLTAKNGYNYTLVYKYIRVGRIIDMCYEQLYLIFNMECKAWRETNSALLNIMSKPTLEIIADHTVDNNTEIPNIIRVRISLLWGTTIDQIKAVPLSSINSYVWYNINNHSTVLHEVALMRKFFKIDKMILTNTGDLEIMYSLKGDTNCSM